MLPKRAMNRNIAGKMGQPSAAARSAASNQLGGRNQSSSWQPTVGASKNATRIAPQSNQTSGNNLQQYQQKITTPTLPIVNAPTSLTNLAQLSGITLLPIAGNRLQTNSVTAPAASKASSSATPVNNNNSSNTPPQSVRQRQSGNTASARQTLNTNHNQKLIKINSQQPIYNLTNIPSLQMLNQTSGYISDEAMINNWVSTTLNHDSRQVQPRAQTNKTNSRASSNRKTKTQSNLNLNNQLSQQQQQQQPNNKIQVIPVTDGLPIFSELNDLQPTQSTSCNFNDLLSQPSTDPMDPCTDTNGDLNNISLMKLMAILNNPALTITAVGSNIQADHKFSPPMEDHQKTSNAALDLIDSQPVCITVPSNTSSQFNQFESNYSQITPPKGKNQRIDLQSRARMPQSATNLQIVRQASVIPLTSPSKRNQPSATNSKNSSSNNVKDQSSAYSQHISDQHNHELNWLANYEFKGGSKLSSQNTSTNWLDNSSARTTDSSEHERLEDPTLQSTSVRNLMMQQLPSSAKNTSASVQLLKHIADQSKDNNWTSSQTSVQKSVLEPECIISLPRSLPQVINNQARQVQVQKIVESSSSPKKSPKTPLQTTRNRLYLPRLETTLNKRRKAVSEPNFNLNDIFIRDGESKEILISEEHHILDCMMSDENKRKPKGAMPEPDEIFINRSKRVMSLIDTMVERKKRRRFERITGREEPKTSSLEDQCAESEEEWSSDESHDYMGFIKTQLPLEEIETDEKRNHLQCVGLVSRNERNKLMIQRCEEKLKIFSPLALGEPQEISPDIKRFYETVLKTGGDDVQLKIDTNIKRNDLPLIEGLNRNTSRMKMNYMNVLGLEKRSKRTTLYKVKTAENFDANLPKSMDLNKVKVTSTEKQKLEPVVATKQIRNEPQVVDRVIPLKINFASCREAMKPPSKNEYMKSLGLMAS